LDIVSLCCVARIPGTGWRTSHRAQGQDAKRCVLHFWTWFLFRAAAVKVAAVISTQFATCLSILKSTATAWLPSRTGRVEAAMQHTVVQHIRCSLTTLPEPGLQQPNSTSCAGVSVRMTRQQNPRAMSAEACVMQPPLDHHACMRLSQARRSTRIRVPSATFAVNSLLSQTSQSPPPSGSWVDYMPHMTANLCILPTNRLACDLHCL